MKKYLFTLVIIASTMIACNSTNESTNTSESTSKDTSIQNNSTSGSIESVQSPSTESGNTFTTPSAASGLPTTSAKPAAATAPGMNPPHGEPGHLCEIAVGAPLNSAPATPAPTVKSIGTVASPAPVSISTPTVSPTPSAAPAATAPGMNPAHGQPGHDCAIPVGSPLKKK